RYIAEGLIYAVQLSLNCYFLEHRKIQRAPPLLNRDTAVDQGSVLTTSFTISPSHHFSHHEKVVSGEVVRSFLSIEW
ncbi:MAG: hypothetical protein ACRCZI_12350, partial [Cetobacterium sp.]